MFTELYASRTRANTDADESDSGIIELRQNIPSDDCAELLAEESSERAEENHRRDFIFFPEGPDVYGRCTAVGGTKNFDSGERLVVVLRALCGREFVR